MLDLFAQGAAIRKQFTQDNAVGVGPTANQQVSAKIRIYPQSSIKPERPVNTGLSEGNEDKIRKPAESATAEVFELSIKAFNQHGIEITPDDLAFLRQRLPFEPLKRDATVANYRAIWHESMQAVDAPHKKQNKGRFAANTWLRSVTC